MTLTPDADGLLTADEVAAWLKVRPKWVYEAAKRGDIPSIRAGRYVRFDRDALLEWAKAGGKA